MERFCKDLKKHSIKIINYEEKIIPLNDEENKSYEKKKESNTDNDDVKEVVLNKK